MVDACLLLQVPLFDEMDERMLEAICERLRPALYTRGTRLVRELEDVGLIVERVRGVPAEFIKVRCFFFFYYYILNSAVWHGGLILNF